MNHHFVLKVITKDFKSSDYGVTARNLRTEKDEEKSYVTERILEEVRGRMMDEKKLILTTPHYGSLVGRYVLYLGENMDSKEGIAYRNAEEFLKNLPNISLNSELEKSG